MERWQIIVLCVIVAVVWMLLKKVFNRNKVQKEDAGGKAAAAPDDVESWYSRAQDRLGAMDEDFRQEKETEWGELPPEEQLKICDTFMLNNFGEKVVGSFTDEEKLKVGKAHFILRG